MTAAAKLGSSKFVPAGSAYTAFVLYVLILPLNRGNCTANNFVDLLKSYSVEACLTRSYPSMLDRPDLDHCVD